MFSDCIFRTLTTGKCQTNRLYPTIPVETHQSPTPPPRTRSPRPGRATRNATSMLNRKPMPLPPEATTRRIVKSKSLDSHLHVSPSPQRHTLPRTTGSPKPHSPSARRNHPRLVERLMSGLGQLTKKAAKQETEKKMSKESYPDEDIHSNLTILGLQRQPAFHDDRETYANLGEVMRQLQQQMNINDNKAGWKKKTRATIRRARSSGNRSPQDLLPPLPPTGSHRQASDQQPLQPTAPPLPAFASPSDRPGYAPPLARCAPSLPESAPPLPTQGPHHPTSTVILEPAGEECDKCHHWMFLRGLFKCSSNHTICLDCLDQEQSDPSDDIQTCLTANCVSSLKPYLEWESVNGDTQNGGPTGPEVMSPSAGGSDYGLPCGCCYVDLTDDMVQCTDGHLFCTKCLYAYLQEIVYGQCKPPPECMTDNCECSFPFSQIENVLSEDELAQYGNRLQREAMSMAGVLPLLLYCPACEFPAIPDEGVVVFSCPRCQHQSCCQCRVDWKEHKGKTCQEVEKNDETRLRVRYEEQMSEICIRRCSKCDTSFTKSDGCNRITCQCGATMCYICRTPDITYEHFCRHLHEPGKGCKKCKSCCLFTNVEEDELRAIRELKEAAQVERTKEGFIQERIIGVPMEKKVKANKK